MLQSEFPSAPVGLELTKGSPEPTSRKEKLIVIRPSDKFAVNHKFGLISLSTFYFKFGTKFGSINSHLYIWVLMHILKDEIWRPKHHKLSSSSSTFMFIGFKAKRGKMVILDQFKSSSLGLFEPHYFEKIYF